MNVRFRDSDQAPVHAERRYLVRCPRCDRQAVVEPAVDSSSDAMHVICGACGYSRSSAADGPDRWTGPVVLRVAGRCGGCGCWVFRNLGSRVKPPKHRTGNVRCPTCQHVTAFTLQLGSPATSEARDPHFGLVLWLQTSCCGERLWAWNEAHLAFLENYVSAKLREREPNRNASMASRLPKWMKDAKHRAAILDAIALLRTVSG